ncbi:pseudouridine synthase [Helicobacter sp. 16-1353]|uniref:pseudouridine synthase n=1 Tax=Helicobacter sp. 16-1353 TaxID=2004996 RepID=UPI000DCC7935|nr:pseudouridine synthase [Helicobacter sp. 16-1353]RAX54705.1 pseudouridine synthase [Helicobacter sp. 16-1353]
MRINQWIAHNTHYSRREADNLIKEGKVKINHKIAELSDKIPDSRDFGKIKKSVKNATDSKDSKDSRILRIFINGKEIKPKDSTKYSVVAYHKPKGEIVSKVDDRGRKTIYESLGKFSHFLPVGRLDFASSGLLLLSDSPKVIKALMESKLERIYNLKVSGKITQKIIDSAFLGMSVEDARAGGHKNSKIISMDFAPFGLFEVISENEKYTKIKVGISEGKNRELRRFFAYFGLEVLELKRVSYGFISLNALPVGKSRFLNKSEYNKLHDFLGDNLKTKVKNASRNKRK